METAETKPNTVIELSDVTLTGLSRPDMAPIEHITWRIAAGDFWVVGGMYGAGKSDLIATVAGLQRPSAGTVMWFGRDIWTQTEREWVDERMRIGVVFEAGGRMFRDLTVAENVALPLRYHRNLTMTEVEGELAVLLRLAGLESRAHITASKLSPGWQQRVGLARALALKPDILLLDQPMMGLGHRRWWREFLASASSGSPLSGGRRLTIVLTVEDLGPWVDIGHQFAALTKSRWQFLGQRAELAAKPDSLREFWTEE